MPRRRWAGRIDQPGRCWRNCSYYSGRIADFESSGPELSLNAEVPGLGVGLLDMRVDPGDAGRAAAGTIAEEGEVGLRDRLLVGCRLKLVCWQSVAQCQRAWRKGARGAGVVRIQREGLIEERALIGDIVPVVLIGFGEPAQAVSGADYR